MTITRRNFLRAGLALPVVAAWPAFAASSSGDLDPLTLEYFDFPPAELARLRRLIAAGLLEIAPVAHAPKNSKYQHLGWPVATQLPSGRIIVTFKRKTGHGDDEVGTDLESGRHVIWTDDLEVWHPGDLVGAESRIGPHTGMHCVGWTRTPEGSVRALLLASANPELLYASDDEGQSWREMPFDLPALEEAVHCGPNMPTNAAFGLVAVFGQEKKGRKNFLVRTLDAGRTWEDRTWLNAERARSVEPALATWGPGHMVMISREFNDDFGRTPDGFFGHTQHVYRYEPGAKFEEVKFTTARTNIIGNLAAGTGCHDTAEVIFNPVSGRVETLQSHRWGGGLGRTGTTVPGRGEGVNTLNLWSIDPEALLGGSSEWRFDGTVVERKGYSGKGDKDGLHPGGSIVDLQRGMQHIFVYAGWRRAPTGIYRISRTLDTDRWRQEAMAG